MKIYRYEDSLRGLCDEKKPIVFLAGPTVRGHQTHLTSWRPDAIAEFAKQGYEGNIIIPEFELPTESDKGKLWIPAWEFAGLLISDINLFWIPRTKELIGLTTNHEQGYWLAKRHNKLTYGRPEGSYRNGYNDLMHRFDAEQEGYVPTVIHTTLETLVRETIDRAYADLGLHRERSKVYVDSPYVAFGMNEQ